MQGSGRWQQHAGAQGRQASATLQARARAQAPAPLHGPARPLVQAPTALPTWARPPAAPRRRWSTWESRLAFYDRTYGKLMDEWYEDVINEGNLDMVGRAGGLLCGGWRVTGDG